MLYDLVATLMRPVAWWGRLGVDGLEYVPECGPLLVVPNHDSQWDPATHDSRGAHG
jgi:1-acyl-sn-glycerol-3-phosphate acyltransferase